MRGSIKIAPYTLLLSVQYFTMFRAGHGRTFVNDSIPVYSIVIMLHRYHMTILHELFTYYTALLYSSQFSGIICLPNVERLVRTILVTCPLHTISGCGKREAYIISSMVIPEKAAPVIELLLELLALCWRNLGSERHRYALRAGRPGGSVGNLRTFRRCVGT